MRWLHRTLVSWWCLFLFVPLPAWAQQSGAPPATPTALHVSRIAQMPASHDQITSAAPDITLVPHGESARTGMLWIRTLPDGLYIAGKVYGSAPQFPHSQEEILSKDHVEVWLAAAPDVELPQIGWGNQFEDVTLPKGAESCAEWAKGNEASQPGPDGLKQCQTWAAAQAHYRPYFKRLFVRQWLLAPGMAVESFAAPAFGEIQKRFSGMGDEIADLMKPHGDPTCYIDPEGNAYTFAVFIPLAAFPPLPDLSVSELHLLVDVFNAAPGGKKTGDYSTSSAARVWGKPATFNALKLDPAFSLQLTPCGAPLKGTDKRGDEHAAWFIPDSRAGNPYQPDAFIIVNDPAGYRYGPAGLSPSVRVIHHFWKSAGKDEWVCGPDLAYRKGDVLRTFKAVVGEDGFDTRRLPDGRLLIKTGPRVYYSEFGSGECGACPRTDVKIIALDQNLNFQPALDLGNVVGHVVISQDFTVSPDWLRVTEFDQKTDPDKPDGPWVSATWCLDAKDPRAPIVYDKCEEKQNVKPPDPPVLKDAREDGN